MERANGVERNAGGDGRLIEAADGARSRITIRQFNFMNELVEQTKTA